MEEDTSEIIKRGKKILLKDKPIGYVNDIDCILDNCLIRS
jgi:hypothetical protein